MLIWFCYLILLFFRPNVCRSRYRNYCCPGWTLRPSTGLCIIRKLICCAILTSFFLFNIHSCLVSSNKRQQSVPDRAAVAAFDPTFVTGEMTATAATAAMAPLVISLTHWFIKSKIKWKTFLDGGSSSSNSLSANSCPNLCQNGGSCIGKKCVCRPGFSGEACEDGNNN